jgi:hypothetical protein
MALARLICTKIFSEENQSTNELIGANYLFTEKKHLHERNLIQRLFKKNFYHGAQRPHLPLP